MDEPTIPREVRRSLTSVFIDVVGSTPVSVLLDDVEYNALIEECRNLVRAAAERHGGTVHGEEGDGRFVSFGWPLARRDDADRAVAMALELLDGIAPIAERVRSAIGLGLSIRVGIHTGPQILNLYEGRAPDARGGTVNVAAKVQQRCEPGSVLVSEATAGALTRAFELVPFGMLTIDGLAGGINLFRVVGPGTSPPPSGLFAGRDEELADLDARWREAAAGGSASVVLVGAAGLGKTRLVTELSARSDAPTVVFATGDEQRSDDPLHVLGQALVRAGLVAPDGVPTSPDEACRLIRTVAADGPLLLVLDDAQWLDATTCDVAALLLTERVPRVLVVVATRPGATNAPWAELAETMRVAPLDDHAAARILDSLDDVSGTLADARSTIIERGGGNPLFLRWLARTAVDTDYEGVRRVLRPRSGVPVVLQHVVRSVLDASGVDDATTSTAAAIGMEFDAALVATVLDRSASAVEADLRALAAHEIVRRAESGVGHYAFGHALVRDLAYDLLLPDEAARRHGRIADTLAAWRPDDHALIGFHYDRAGRAEPAARAKLRAARQCRAIGAYREGAAHTARVLELNEQHPLDDPALALEANELRHLFATVTDQRAYAAGERAPTPALLDALPPLERDRWRCMEKTSQWAAASMTGDLRRSAGLLYEVYRIGPVGLPGIVPFNQCARGYQAMLRGRFAHAETLLRRSTERMRQIGLDPWMAEHWPAPDDPIALGFAYLPPVLVQRGYQRSGIDWLRRAWQRAETLPNGAYSMAHVSMNSALFWAVLGDGMAVVEQGRDMTKLGAELEVDLWRTLGGVFEQLGAAIAAPSAYSVGAVARIAQMFEALSAALPITLHLYAAQSALRAGLADLAGTELDATDRLSARYGLRQYEAEARRLRAALGQGDERTGHLVEAVRLARRSGARRYGLRALVDLVEHRPDALVDGAPASAQLADAVRFPETDGDPDVERARDVLPDPVR